PLVQDAAQTMTEEGRTLSEGDLVKKVLDDALAGVPLPTPWEVIETEGGSYFNQKTTGETTWNHPLQAHLEELSALALRCLGLKPKERWQAAKLLRQRFQVEAEREYQCWYAAEDGSSGSCYFCHRDTGDAMWEHPAGVVLPQFYLKIRCAELLLDDEYLRGLREAEDPPSPEGRLGRTISKLLGIRSTSKESLKSQATPFGSSCSTVSFFDEGLDDGFDDEDEKGIESDEECAREVALMVDRWVEEP
ncbi:Hypothetical protein SCF082_LOCUS10370, partial [Durusdinium trenchii]